MQWTNEELEIMQAQYGKHTAQDMQKLLPRHTHRAIINKAYDLKIKADKSITSRRDNFDNHFYFHIPNIENSYWAGYLAADGNIDKDSNRISFIQKDKSVLKRFQECIKYTQGKITSRTDKKLGNVCSYIRISSKQMVEDLAANFNIIPNKSLVLEPPTKLNYQCALAYITGYIDGDGCIRWAKIKKHKFVACSITGTKNNLIWMTGLIDPTITIYARTDSKNVIYNAHVSWKKARKFLTTLALVKELDHLRLKRKWDKVYEFYELPH
jgi:hypothetical protein